MFPHVNICFNLHVCTENASLCWNFCLKKKIVMELPKHLMSINTLYKGMKLLTHKGLQEQRKIIACYITPRIEVIRHCLSPVRWTSKVSFKRRQHEHTTANSVETYYYQLGCTATALSNNQHSHCLNDERLRCENAKWLRRSPGSDCSKSKTTPHIAISFFPP